MSFIETSFELDRRRKYFRHGQGVTGHFRLRSTKDISVNRIEASLLCDEFAGISLGFTSEPYQTYKNYSKAQKIIHYSSKKQQLFPSPQLLNITNNKQKQRDFKITSGTHCFNFSFKIPRKYNLTSANWDGGNYTVSWKLEAKIVSNELGSRGLISFMPLAVVTPTSMISQGHFQLSVEHAILKLRSKDIGVRTQSLFKRDTGQRKIPMKVELTTPSLGLQQSPLTMGAQVLITYPDTEVLRLKSFSIYLKEKTKYTLNGDNISSIQSMDYRILVSNPDIALKGGVNRLDDILSEAKISFRLAGSVRTELIQRTYALKFEITICDSGARDIMGTIRLKFPVTVQSPLASYAISKLPENEEQLPRYTVDTSG